MFTAKNTALSLIYDSEDIILEYTSKEEDNDTEEEITRYTHGPGIDEPISILKGLPSLRGATGDEAIYYYHYDGLDNLSGLLIQT
jgi:hypothetical protein